jgi:hypothetical protein
VSIVVDPAVRAGLRPEATMLIQVVADADPARLAVALRAAGADIAALDGGWRSAVGLRPGDRNGPKYVSAPVPAPGGQLMLLDAGSTPADLLATVPDLITARLREAGVPDATMVLPPRIGDRYGVARSFRPAARATLRGPLVAPLGAAPSRPPAWLRDIAGEWLRPAADRGGAELLGVVISAEVPLSWDMVDPVTSGVLGSGTAPAVVLVSDFASSVAAFAVGGGFAGLAPEASLTAAAANLPGVEVTAAAGRPAAQVTAAMREQRETVRAHAGELTWAGVTAVPDARDLLSPHVDDRAHAGRPPVDLLSDLLVPDAMWHQVLSAGHLRRLGGPPDGAVALPGGRVELTVGEPEQWLPGHPDGPAVRACGRRSLAGCLATADEVAVLTRERLAAARNGQR